MPVTIEAIKEVATIAMKKKYGEELGAAYAFLMFGGAGIPGMVDGATLVARGNSTTENEIAEEMALNLVKDAAKIGLEKMLQASAAKVLKTIGLTAEAVAAASVIIITGLLTPTDIAPEPMPSTPTPVPKPSPSSSGGSEGPGGDVSGGAGTTAGEVIGAARKAAANNNMGCEAIITEIGASGKEISIRIKIYPQ